MDCGSIRQITSGVRFSHIHAILSTQMLLANIFLCVRAPKSGLKISIFCKIVDIKSANSTQKITFLKLKLYQNVVTSCSFEFKRLSAKTQAFGEKYHIQSHELVQKVKF